MGYISEEGIKEVRVENIEAKAKRAGFPASAAGAPKKVGATFLSGGLTPHFFIRKNGSRPLILDI